MNDLIKDTPMQDALKEFQMVRHLGRPEFEYGTLTQGWWKGFKHRNGHLVVSKRGERFACSRADWTKKSNLAMMYNVIYDEMIDAGIAENLPHLFSLIGRVTRLRNVSNLVLNRIQK